MSRPGLRIGIDIGGTKTCGIAIRPDNSIAAEVARVTVPGVAAVFSTVLDVMEELHAISGESIAGPSTLGIGIPGLVDSLTGEVRQAVNLRLTQWRLADDVFRAKQIRPIVDNDVNAAALGAQHLLGLSGSLAYLNFGTGVAAGLVVGGRVLRGARGAAGEIGHVVFDPVGSACACGQGGCIESIAGGAAFVLAAGSVGNPVREIFDRAEQGEPVARRFVDRFAAGAASAIRLLILSVDVDWVVVGGGVAVSDPRVEIAIRGALAKTVAQSEFLRSLAIDERVRFVGPEVAAATIGAALLPAEALLRESQLDTS